jgi:hypothetical protein
MRVLVGIKRPERTWRTFAPAKFALECRASISRRYPLRSPGSNHSEDICRRAGLTTRWYPVQRSLTIKVQSGPVSLRVDARGNAVEVAARGEWYERLPTPAVCLPWSQDRDFFLKALIRHRPLVLLQVGPQTARSHPQVREADPRGVTRRKARSRSRAAGQQHFGSARPWIVPTWPRPLVNQRLLTMNV